MQNAPCGSGKSLTAVAAAALTGRTVYLTASRALQKQLLDDFGSSGMVKIVGRANYSCSMLKAPKGTCEDGRILGCTAHKSGNCSYNTQRLAALESPLPCTNYAYWMAVNKYGDGLGPDVDMLICDEAGSIVDLVCNFLAVELPNRELHACKLKVPAEVSSGEDLLLWRQWAADAAIQVTELRAANAEALQKSAGNPDLLRNAKAYNAFILKLQQVATLEGSQWIADEMLEYSNSVNQKVGWRFDPLWPAPYTERVLWNGVPKILLMSATVNRKTCSLLGVLEQEMNFFSYPSTFDPRRSPIYEILNTARVDKNMSEDAVRSWIARADQILRLWPHDKGIFHCVSYQRMKDFCNASSERARLIWHSSWDAQAKIERFRSMKPESGAVLVSPAVTTGYDFIGDLARFQIMGKMPLIDSRSKIMQARLKQDRQYGDYLSAQTFYQAVKRPVRSESDWAVTYLIDNHASWFVGSMKRKGLLPQDLYVEQVSEIPERPRYAAR